MPAARHRPQAVLIPALILALASAGATAARAERIKLHVGEPGVYAVTHQELLAAGFKAAGKRSVSSL